MVLNSFSYKNNIIFQFKKQLLKFTNKNLYIKGYDFL